MTLDVAPPIREALSEYMREHHIAEVLATGCFLDARFDLAGDRFRTSYHAATRADLERYLSQHAARLRDDFARHFPDGVTASREVWEMSREWSQPAEASAHPSPLRRA